jgi:hypothetical protein
MSVLPAPVTLDAPPPTELLALPPSERGAGAEALQCNAEAVGASAMQLGPSLLKSTI